MGDYDQKRIMDKIDEVREEAGWLIDENKKLWARVAELERERRAIVADVEEDGFDTKDGKELARALKRLIEDRRNKRNIIQAAMDKVPKAFKFPNTHLEAFPEWVAKLAAAWEREFAEASKFRTPATGPAAASVAEKRDIAWAAKMLREGNRVRRKDWKPGYRLESRGGPIGSFDGSLFMSGIIAFPLFDDPDAEWELYAEAAAKEPETFGWPEALERMRAGKKVRRDIPNWSESSYWYMDADFDICLGPGCQPFDFIPTKGFTATDWREVQP
jgi:hypothetical protein